MKPFTRIGATVFAIVCLAHLARLCLRWDITIHGISIPLWVSAIAGVVTGSLAGLLWRESRGQ